MSVLNFDKNSLINKIEEIQLTQNNCLIEKDSFSKQLQEKQSENDILKNLLETEKQLNEDKVTEIFTLKLNLRDLEDKLEYITKDKEVN